MVVNEQGKYVRERCGPCLPLRLSVAMSITPISHIVRRAVCGRGRVRCLPRMLFLAGYRHIECSTTVVYPSM